MFQRWVCMLMCTFMTISAVNTDMDKVTMVDMMNQDQVLQSLQSRMNVLQVPLLRTEI